MYLFSFDKLTKVFVRTTGIKLSQKVCWFIQEALIHKNFFFLEYMLFFQEFKSLLLSCYSAQSLKTRIGKQNILFFSSKHKIWNEKIYALPFCYKHHAFKIYLESELCVYHYVSSPSPAAEKIGHRGRGWTTQRSVVI